MSVISLEEWRSKQALLSESKSPSPQSIPWADLGVRRTEVDDYIENLVCLYTILDRSWRRPFTVKSDFAREGALHVAIAASEGFISTKIDEEAWGRRWLITELGKEVKGEIENVLKEILQPEHTTD